MHDDTGDELLTIDELALLTGTSVRTTRYYASLGMLPPPVRRGRMAYYGAEHRARLELVRSLHDHGLTLTAIDRYLARLPADASAEDLAVHRAMLTAWLSGGSETLTPRQLETRAGRPLPDRDVRWLVAIGAVARTDDATFEVLPAFDVAVQLLDRDVPLRSVLAVNEAITRHMEALADELTEILRSRVLRRPRRSSRSGRSEPRRDGSTRDQADPAGVGQTLWLLRRLTLELAVSGFQRAADQVVRRSLSRE